MRERPILFNGAMVRAILSGHKSQTRRAMKPQPSIDASGNFCWNGWNFGQDMAGRPLSKTLESQLPCSRTGRVHCPFGKIGDRLWVRETWMDLTGTGVEHRDMETGKHTRYAYGAESPKGSASDEARKDFGLKWRPSIHMPRDACRLVLEITDVRVERLQAISAADAEAEGLRKFPFEDSYAWAWRDGDRSGHASPTGAFRSLWTSTGGDWDANPWVWVISFKRLP